jgi:hypothetical protein
VRSEDLLVLVLLLHALLERSLDVGCAHGENEQCG